MISQITPGRTRMLSLLGMLCLTASLFLFLHHRSVAPNPAPIDLYACIDNSESNKNQIPSAARSAARAGSLLAPDGRFTLYALNHDLNEILPSQPVGSRSRLTQAIVEALRVSSTRRRPGTRFHLLFEEMRRRSQRSAHPVALILYTDGYPDGMTATDFTAMRAALKALAGDPKVRFIALVSDVGETRALWRRLCEEAFPQALSQADRYGLFTTEGFDPVVALQETAIR